MTEMMPSETAPPLQIHLLGPLEVRVDGRPLPRLRSRKGLWLLALLALRQGRAMERDWLAGTLWPESGESQALYNLRQSLSNLRQALGTQALRLQSPSKHTLRLDLTGAECDLTAFDTALAYADAALLEQAIAVYRGPLLEGCTEEWVLSERAAREQAYLQALEQAAEHALTQGKAETAVGYLRRAVALDPLQESAQRALMQALAAAGDFAALVQVYRDLRLHLHRELNAEPDPQTTALFARLRRQTHHQTKAAALNPVSAPPPSLPRPLTPLIGRQTEVQQIQTLLASERLVTLIGAGGVGKTRLALQLAEEADTDFPHGVWFVELAALSDAALVTQTVAATLGVREQPGRALVETLSEHLQSKALLLVLDNCEHLLEGCAPLVQRLLQVCLGLRILATSRQTLGLSGERIYRVPSLSVPNVEELAAAGKERAALLMEYEAPQLFVMRAAQAEPTFAVTEEIATEIGQICVRLEGIPLALELAAARVKVLTPGQLVSRLDDRFRLLTGGSRTALARHQTLRATLDWSYGLLSEPEQRLLERLSVFAGGWTLEAAEAVCDVDFLIRDLEWPEIQESDEARLERAEIGLLALQNPRPRIQGVETLDILASLVDKSLVEYVSHGQARYRLLETVRQYAQERVEESGEVEQLRRRHRDYFVPMAEIAAVKGLGGPEQVAWSEWWDTEHDNLRTTLAECKAAEDGIEAELRLTGVMWCFWWSHGYMSEGRAHLMAALERKGACDRTRARTDALRGAGIITGAQGDYEAAKALFEEGLALSRERGDKKFIAGFLTSLGDMNGSQGNFETARTFFEEGLAVAWEVGNKGSVADALRCLADVARAQGDYEAARALVEQSLAFKQELGQTGLVAGQLYHLGIIVTEIGDFTAAERLYEQSLAISCELGDKHLMALVLLGQGNVAYEQGDDEAAGALYEQSLAMLREFGQKKSIANALNGLGNVAYRQGDYETAGAKYAQSLAIQWEIGNKWGMTFSLRAIARLTLVVGQPERAARLWGAAEALRHAIGSAIPPIAQDECANLVAAMRTALDEEAFAAAWAQGQAMSLEQAVALATEESD